MKTVIYGTLLLFIVIMISVMVIASHTPVETVTYKNGVIVADP